jgi:predicted amidohydrolase YtcJ
MKSWLVAASIFALVAVAACKPSEPESGPGSTASADLIIHGGPILTMEGVTPTYVEAVVVDEGQIVFAGSDVEAMKLKADGTRVKDLGGKAMLPGFVDGHSHFMFAINMAQQVNVAASPVGPGDTIPAIVAALQGFQQERQIPKGEWIVGWGYDGATLQEGRDMTRTDLDAAFPDHKVMTIHVSGHGAVLNSKALEWAGLTADSPTPAGGIIARMADGKTPAGLIMERAYEPVFSKMPQPTEAEMLDLMKPAQMMYASNGYTLVNEGFTHAKDISFLQKAAAGKRMFLDFVAWPGFTDIPAWLDKPEFPFNTWQDRLKLGGLKITLDGSPQGKTAYVTTPFLTGGPQGQKGWRGEPNLPYADLEKLVLMAHGKGLQLIIHANGDAAIDDTIKALGVAGIKAGDDSRPVVIHSQFQRPDQLAKYKELGVTPSYFTNHAYFWGDVHRRNIGETKAAFISPMKAAVDAGLVIANHSDFNVTPLDPMFMLWSSMARTTRSGFVLGPDQRVDAYTGLKALTSGPAYLHREEKSRGSIAPGKLADFVILSADPVGTPVDGIRAIKVIETIKEGRTIFPAN